MKLLTKYTVILFLAFLFVGSNSAFAGIDFFDGTWAEALAEAKSKRKLIFVDAYTVWCGPCKAMSRNTFPDERVGEFYNENFISYKFDMEKGEGPAFAEKYQVLAYPTLLFINHNGDQIHKAVGYLSPPQLMTEGRKALDPKKNQALLELEYEAGSDDPEVLLNYALNQYKEEGDYRAAGAKYFATQTDKELLSNKNWEAIKKLTTEIDSREYQYLLTKQKKFIKKQGIQPVLDKIYEVCKKQTLAAALTGDKARYEAALNVANTRLKKEYPKGMTANRLRMVYAEATKDWEDYAQKAIYHFETYTILRSKELDHAAGLFHKHVDDPDQLQHALKWAKQSVALENEFYNNNTYAHLLYKTGNYSEALKYANIALRLATLDDADASQTQKLAEKIRGKLR